MLGHFRRRRGAISRRLVFAILGAVLVASAGAALLFSGWFDRPPPWSAEMQTVADGNNRFAFDLYGCLREQPGNQFYSPYSVHTALSMAALGANGATREQMLRTLHLPSDEENLLAAGDLARFYTVGRKPYQLSVANAVWGQKDAAWEAAFTGHLKNRFGAPLRTADFAAYHEAERKRINDWVEDRTRDRIKELLPLGSLDHQTAMVLANAIYFKGAWDQAFKKDDTRDDRFFLAGGGSIMVPLMHQAKCRCRYKEFETFQVLELPYKGGDLAMVVILPKKPDGLPEVEKQLTAANLGGWMKDLEDKQEFPVYLPRFRLEQPESTELIPFLQQLGMVDAFDPFRADFTRMLPAPSIFINHVVHKAFVEVNEAGTEAAAATGVTFKFISASIPLHEFRANRPFTFLIRDRERGTILFMGRLEKPEE